jgi:hypothetical protein
MQHRLAAFARMANGTFQPIPGAATIANPIRDRHLEA